MTNFGYYTDDVNDSASFFWAEPDDFELLSVDSLSDNLALIEPEDETIELDDKDDFSMEDLMKGYEIYNNA